MEEMTLTDTATREVQTWVKMANYAIIVHQNMLLMFLFFIMLLFL